MPPLTTLGKQSRARDKAFTKFCFDSVLLAKDSPHRPPLVPLVNPNRTDSKYC